MLTPRPWCSEARKRTKGRRLILGLLGIAHARLRHGLAALRGQLKAPPLAALGEQSGSLSDSHAFALTTSQCWRKRLWGQARGFGRPSRNGPFKAFQSVGLHRVRSATALSMAS
jgi:hypothetical protein